ncbi:zinc-finger of a C2HC-type family protein [Leishmania donovani]|uniref:Zinc-finger of a C2HC-type family protein n=1 Tax=Leishmania donovani TaxID=5661 RepID=A0A504XQ21_LEIDO|nr:zinc-finger of a C2HC-type family protein [Leishmania donovani]
MSATRDGPRSHSDGGFDGRSLLSEQTKLLRESTPADINFIQFLKLRLSAQQRATAQRNYWQRVQREAADSMNPNTARWQGRGGIPASAAPISTAAASSVEGASFSTYDAEHVILEHSTTSFGTLPRQDALMRATSHGAVTPPTVHQHSFEDLPAAVLKRRGAPASELTDFVAVSTTEPSEDGNSSQRRPSGPLPEEDAYVLAPFSTSSYSAAAAAAIDERPAMACGKPQVPVDVDEMKDVELEPCPHCGRTFAPARLERHVATCERHKNTLPKTKGDMKSGRARSAFKPEKWRKQSAQLRNAMAGASVAVDDDRVPCPSCGRHFSDDVAARHIPICKSKGGRAA